MSASVAVGLDGEHKTPAIIISCQRGVGREDPAAGQDEQALESGKFAEQRKFDCHAASDIDHVIALPVPLPPSIALTPEHIRARVTDKFLLNLDQFSVFDPSRDQKIWRPNIRTEELLHVSPSAATSILQIKRDPLTFNEFGFEEARLGLIKKAESSMNVDREIAPNVDHTYGTTLQFPFLPAGMRSARLMQNYGSDPTATKSSLPFSQQTGSSLFTFNENLCLPELGSPDKMEALSATTQVNENDDGSDKQLDSLIADLKLPLIEAIDQGNAATHPAFESDSRPSSLQKVEEEQIKPVAVDLSALEAATNISRTQSQDQEENEEVDAILSKVFNLKLSSNSSSEKAMGNFAVAIPSSNKVEDFDFQVPHPAMTYPFELDDFQKQAIICMERHESVFVAAHTSAGKTVVAEYAIAMSKQHMTRCIYTSPIKALSNQKFRDLWTQFEDVGLLTGDVQIRPNASCLIMTTEILRSMLYRGADLIRDVEWVIFDEVHYINNPERGVVWEETIIMLPKHVKVIMLSATVPNTFDFADWVGRTRRQRVYVISTPRRPVPLAHYLYVPGNSSNNSDLWQVVDPSGRFLQKNYYEAVQAQKNSTKSQHTNLYGPKRNFNFKDDRSTYTAFVRHLLKKNLTPCVVFTFSKDRCDKNARHVKNNKLTTANEEKRINTIFHRSISILSGSDRDLPQIRRVHMLVLNGVGVHHAGLLPIMKELIEILFSQGLIKVLFATETFAMGVNMPAKCVAFDSTTKFDSQQRRDLQPGEYIQMAGRAGRRGLDTTGTVIIICKRDVPEGGNLRHMILGQPTTLTSRFRLTYNMILNLLRVEGLKVEDMMRSSFSEAALQRECCGQEQELEQGQAKLRILGSEEFPPDLEEFYNSSVEFLDASHRMIADILNSASGVQRLGQNGRVIVINNQKYRNAIAVILRMFKGTTIPGSSVKEFEVLVMTGLDSSVADEGERLTLPLPVTHFDIPKGPVGYDILRIPGTDIVMISKEVLEVDEKKALLKDKTLLNFLSQQLLRIAKQGVLAIKQMHPKRDMGVNKLDATDAFSKMQSLQERLSAIPDMRSAFVNYTAPINIRSLQSELSDDNLILLPEYEQRIQVMQHLRFINNERIVELK
eukprot:gene1045-4279_t